MTTGSGMRLFKNETATDDTGVFDQLRERQGNAVRVNMAAQAS